MQASLAGLGEAERELLRAKAVAQPFRTYTQPLRLTRAFAGDYERAIIACDDFRAVLAAGIPRFQVLTPTEWQVHEIETGHTPMLSAPGDLAKLLDGPVVGR